jgi:hypothetical protein
MMLTMKRSPILSTVCLAGLLACGIPPDSKIVGPSVSMKTQTITIHQNGTYTNKKGKRLLDGNQLGEFTEVQVRQVDCSGNDVLLLWHQTAVRFPGVWPADEALVINGTFENPPIRLTFPAPVDGDAKSVLNVVWSADKLIVDGSPYDLISGGSYVFTESSLKLKSLW